MKHPRTESAFSLVEIVLAVGIVSVALLAIFGLFGTALRSNAETLSQNEVLGMTRSFSDYLHSTNGGAGFTNVFGWVKVPATAPEIYALVSSNGSLTNGLGSDASFVAAAGARSGRLFRMVCSLSPSMPVRNASGALVSRPSPSDLPATAAAYTNDFSLALQVRAYAVPAIGGSITNLLPVFAYETTVSRQVRLHPGRDAGRLRGGSAGARVAGLDRVPVAGGLPQDQQHLAGEQRRHGGRGDDLH